MSMSVRLRMSTRMRNQYEVVAAADDVVSFAHAADAADVVGVVVAGVGVVVEHRVR